MIGKEIYALVFKEIQVEWRTRHSLNALLLYIVSSIWVVYLSFSLLVQQISPLTWNALFWIIFLFASVNSVAKSFLQEREGQLIYLYTLVSPVGIIFAKIIYNSLFLSVVASLGLLVYMVLLGNPVQDFLLFALNLLAGSFGFAALLTLVAGIAAKAQNPSALMAILSFPVVIPMLLMLIKISKNALDGLDWYASQDEFFTLTAIYLIILSLSYFLFPYLWRS